MNLDPLPWAVEKPTALLILADGTIIKGKGFGAIGARLGEICFNTSLTGYQEILTDPSYSRQIITFTFPHIGNTGINEEDMETLDQNASYGAAGIIMRAQPCSPSNYRATQSLDAWLKAKGIPGIFNVDTRALTCEIRKKGVLHAVLSHSPEGLFDTEILKEKARSWLGLSELDLPSQVTTQTSSTWSQTSWKWEKGYGIQTQTKAHIVVIDYGVKRNILRLLSDVGARVTCVPSKTNIETLLALNPDGVLLSNGPGDPSITGSYAIPTIQKLIELSIPIFGICLGHQLLALALGGKTEKMHQGHHGANHPVKEKETGKVKITSMNHGFTVVRAFLPGNVEETHVSLFDGSNCGFSLKNKPVFSVQYHPESSPGPEDSHDLFRKFMRLIEDYQSKKQKNLSKH